MDVYVVQHSYEDDDHEDTKFIGVYESEELAKDAVEGLRRLPGFRSYPEGFSIDRYQLNQTWWLEGFVDFSG